MDGTSVGVIAIIVAALATFATFIGQQMGKPKWVYAGASFILGSALLQCLTLVLSSRESSRFQQEIRRSNRTAIERDNEIQRLQREGLTRADKIADLSQALAAKNEELANYVSGGSSFAVIQPKTIGDSVEFLLRQQGRYPLYNLRVDVRRLTPEPLFGAVVFGQSLFGGRAELPLRLARPEIQELGIGENISVGRDSGLHSPSTDYLVWIHARNGWSQQRFTVRATASGWVVDKGQQSTRFFR
jgi:hypothetical protein